MFIKIDTALYGINDLSLSKEDIENMFIDDEGSISIDEDIAKILEQNIKDTEKNQLIPARIMRIKSREKAQ